jgi:hypothetical protein
VASIWIPGGYITDLFQLSTMDPQFDIAFDQDGMHTITLSAAIDDVWGNTSTGGGTYEVHVAQTLVLDTTVLPGTPFTVGDVFNPGLVVSPAVPASVQVRMSLAPNSDPAAMIVNTVEGVANRYGYFLAHGQGIAVTQPGEYRVDITASYRDELGKLWIGSRTVAGVVAPANPGASSPTAGAVWTANPPLASAGFSVTTPARRSVVIMCPIHSVAATFSGYRSLIQRYR